MTYRVWHIPDLTEADLARAAALACQADRQTGMTAPREEAACRRHEVGWLLTATLAGAWLGMVPETLRWERGPHGKPLCRSGPVCVNVSHAGDWVLGGVSAGPIGVDIETRRCISPALCDKVCCPAEKRYVTAPGGDPTDRFLRLWTAKEAYVKYTGEGISRAMNTVPVADETGLFDRVGGVPLRTWQTAAYWAALVGEEPAGDGR